MQIFKLSLGTGFFDDAKFAKLSKSNLVSVYPDNKGKGRSKKSQADLFLEAKKGDLFYICRSNQSIELLGMFIDERPLYSTIDNHEHWTDRSYQLLWKAKKPTGYDKQYNKWWTPKNLSTFTKVKSKEVKLFQDKILKPVFDISFQDLQKKRNFEIQQSMKDINYYAKIQEDFAKLKNDSNQLFDRINNLDDLELKKIQFSYLQRGDISNQPVVLLRYALLEKLIDGTKLTNERITNTKEEISNNFEKNVYKAWPDHFRVLYTFLYDKDKTELVDFFRNLISRIQQDLEIQDKTKFKLVHIDGPQNQGNDTIWFAIYNNIFSSQKTAKQLHFLIHNGEFEYGLYEDESKDRGKLKKSKTYDYDDLLNTFRQYKNEILADNSAEKARIRSYIDILEYKKQIILKGPPGTGKTYSAEKMANQMVGTDGEDQIKTIQFHPSYAYEDFVRGISAKSEGGNIVYKTENKILADFAQKAMMNFNEHENGQSELKNYVLIIDEINRANLPAVLGELIYALEYRSRPVDSMYALDGDNRITLPENLYIIGTMNTADRSVGQIDYAIKRRFAFVEMLPDKAVVNTEKAKKLFDLVAALFIKKEDGKNINADCLAPDFNYKDIQLGHSYFLLKDATEEEQKAKLEMRLKYEIIPILQEYVTDGLLLENAIAKIEKIANFEC